MPAQRYADLSPNATVSTHNQCKFCHLQSPQRLYSGDSFDQFEIK
jgi:hypothetical protein